MCKSDTLHNVISAAFAADAAWQAELTRMFGSRACEARYLPEGRGDAGSVLRELSDARDAATVEYHRSWGAHRNGRNEAHASELVEA